MTIKAILDTNVVISGIFWKGPPFRVLEAWQEQRFRLVISVPILEEYRRVLAEMAGEHFSPVLHSILGLIELHSEMVEPISLAKAVCNDPDDDKFIEAAVAAADYVVRGDTALLRLKDHRGIRMVKPAEFLRLLRR